MATFKRIVSLDPGRKMAHEKIRESRGVKRHLFTPRIKCLSLFSLPSFSRAASQLSKSLKEAATVKLSIQNFFTNFFLTFVTPSQAFPTGNSF